MANERRRNDWQGTLEDLGDGEALLRKKLGNNASPLVGIELSVAKILAGLGLELQRIADALEQHENVSEPVVAEHG